MQMYLGPLLLLLSLSALSFFISIAEMPGTVTTIWDDERFIDLTCKELNLVLVTSTQQLSVLVFVSSKSSKGEGKNAYLLS